MNRQRSLLQEYTKDPKAIKEARSAPIPEPEIDRSLSFLRAIALDLPIQTGGQLNTETKEVVDVSATNNEELKEMKKLAGIK